MRSANRDCGFRSFNMVPVALRFVEIAHSGKPQTAILCVPNQDAIPTLEDTDVVEVTCDVTADSCTPHHVALEDIPAGNLELNRNYIDGWK